ncbi:hypothetical protein AUEXF2481DRAFT_535643 [Aureobasidium subglaciale EXF-2481]|uniref:Uncharacterized protein n=1 Tax=Aureobasidium subglaciale (strain EXF-2481) TaxID=1043005 RepID=A0A074YUT6_AURSE|nr:uncharacterized protein AUEXF2481DRAFT_535643 [Aureobasidium subglaciale EXF-2481]KEQ90586.1 hypothetical protein AUEXF2481DRAFT_535643 [Aureobasidium subglaciale EXF-2481]
MRIVSCMGRVANPRVVPRGPRRRQTRLGISWSTTVAFLGWRRAVLDARILALPYIHGPGKTNRNIASAASSSIRGIMRNSHSSSTTRKIEHQVSLDGEKVSAMTLIWPHQENLGPCR